MNQSMLNVQWIQMALRMSWTFFPHSCFLYAWLTLYMNVYISALCRLRFSFSSRADVILRVLTQRRIDIEKQIGFHSKKNANFRDYFHIFETLRDGMWFLADSNILFLGRQSKIFFFHFLSKYIFLCIIQCQRLTHSALYTVNVLKKI